MVREGETASNLCNDLTIMIVHVEKELIRQFNVVLKNGENCISGISCDLRVYCKCESLI